MRLSNTPLDAELYVLFRFHIADVDLVTYHAIIHEIQLDFEFWVVLNVMTRIAHR